MSTNKEAEVQSFNEAIQERIPEIASPESNHVRLMRGLIDPVSGDWQMDAEVRELTGSDEEYLARIESKQNVTYAEYMSALLRRATVSVGNIKIADNPTVLDNLIIGDRDALFLGIIKCTYGPERTFSTRCTHCEQKNDVTINIDEDFAYEKSSVDLHKPIPVTLKNGKVINLRLPTGADSAYVASTATNPANQTTLMIARCTVWGEGEKPLNVEEWARDLNVVDRNKLVKTLTDIVVGPQMGEVNVHCAHCQEPIKIMIDWISLLLG
jgi:hypothetical protein